MEMNHLRYFYEVAKAGSFTRAARQLRISQSALSKAVALLEAGEGVQLLHRSKKGVSLTPLGQEVYRMSTGIFQSLSEIENTCRGTKEVCEGYLRFGASDHIINYLLAPRLQALLAAHPRVVPSVLSGTPHEVVNLILNNELEFGLFFTRLNIPGIFYEKLLVLPMTVVCHPRLLPKGKPANLKNAVKELGYISSVRSQYQRNPAQDLIDLTEGEGGRIVFETNSQEAQKRFCLAGGGVGFFSRFMVEKELAEGSLVELPIAKPLPVALLLARKKDMPLSLNARTFLKTLESK